jgi:recombination protein RecA
MTIKNATDEEFTDVDWIPTGISKLDSYLGGGIPTKRISEIAGPAGVGKSSLSLMVVGNAQKDGRKALWCDAEWTFEPSFAEKLGVDTKKLLMVRERFAESALDDIEEWAEKNKDSVIVLDAVGALHPREESEKDASSKMIGGQARLVARFCRKMVPIIGQNNIALIFINHTFTDLMSGATKTSGGAKLDYHKSVAIRLKKAYGKQVTRNGEHIATATVIEAEITKNKLNGTQGAKVDLILQAGEGFSRSADLLQEALDKAVIEQKGPYYVFGEQKWKGAHALREALKNEELVAKIKTALTNLTQ